MTYVMLESYQHVKTEKSHEEVFCDACIRSYSDLTLNILHYHYYTEQALTNHLHSMQKIPERLE